MATMESELEPGQQVCFFCAEQEILRREEARKKIRNNLNETDIRPSAMKTPRGPMHLGHHVKRNMAICSYQRFSADRITTNPNEVTCLNCLRRIRKQHGRASDQV